MASISNTAPISAASYSNLNVKPAQSRNTSAFVYLPTRQPSCYTEDEIARAIANISVRDVPVHLFANDPAANGRQSTSHSRKSKSSFSHANMDPVAKFSGIISKVNMSYDIERITPDMTGGVALGLTKDKERPTPEATIEIVIPPVEPKESSKSSLDDIPVTSGKKPNRRAIEQFFGIEEAKKTAKTDSRDTITALPTTRPDIKSNDTLDATRSDEEIASAGFIRRVSVVIDSLLTTGVVGKAKETDTKQDSENDIISVKQTATVVTEPILEYQDEPGQLPTEEPEVFKKQVNRRRSSNLASVAAYTDQTLTGINISVNQPSDTYNSNNHVENRAIEAALEFSMTLDPPSASGGDASFPGTVESASSQPYNNTGPPPPIIRPRRQSKTFYIAGQAAIPNNSPTSQTPRISVQSHQNQSPSPLLGNSSNHHRKANVSLSNEPESRMYNGTASKTSIITSSGGANDGRRRSWATDIVIPKSPSPLQLAIASAGNPSAASHSVSGSYTSMDASHSSVASQSAAVCPPSPNAKSIALSIPQQQQQQQQQQPTQRFSHEEGKSESALKYLQAFAVLRQNEEKANTGGGIFGERKRRIKKEKEGPAAALHAAAAPLDSIVKVVKMASDMQQVGMDPSLAAELDKDTLTMVLKLKKWARSRKRHDNKAEVLMRNMNAEIECELPIHLELDLIQDVLPVIDLYRRTYETQLGSTHAFTLGANRYQKKLKEKLEKGKSFGVDAENSK
ncbi:hypothetical protein BDR26DRAFT_855924 [Obelidium mucronatum]|nr:hypothetical protein BDR26DRAFT_855924 [Obelidium mucronatum]